uniref:Foot protein 7 variant 1 n=1 Tax=Mytilus californianus TaxID=6549 RepID=A0A223HCJ6_MYTCA|nr:foot protein 7 variant 1 [Mytilus californianus]
MKIFGIIVLVALLMVASVTMPVAASRSYRRGYKGSHSSGGHSGHGGKYHGYRKSYGYKG